MSVWIHVLIFFITFFMMEFMAWLTHKYVMHGFLWYLHKDHHKKDHNHWWERNDTFFIFYAVISMSFIMLWSNDILPIGVGIGFGIMAYGLAYFLVHDVFIHQRIKWFRNANNRYAKAIRRAHKMHHKHTGKEDGECFGMLWVPWKYLKNS